MRKKNHLIHGVNEWDAREGRPPGIAGDRQGPRHRKAI